MATPRSQGLLVEAMALKVACDNEADADLLARSRTLYDNVLGAASDAGETWRLYLPSWLGGYQGEADAIATGYSARHGINPLDVDAPPPTGDLAQLGDLASGDVADAASAGADVVAADARAAAAAAGGALPSLSSVTRWIDYALALVVLLVIFYVYERARA